MSNKINIIIVSIISAFFMLSHAQAITLNAVDDIFKVGLGETPDWQTLNGTYDIYTTDDYDIFYDSNDMIGYLPDGVLADLTIIWNQEINGDLTLKDTFILTDELGALIDLEFWINLICHQEYNFEVTSRYIGDRELIPNPLPSSVYVFMTAMFGVGYLARRRRKLNLSSVE